MFSLFAKIKHTNTIITTNACLVQTEISKKLQHANVHGPKRMNPLIHQVHFVTAHLLGRQRMFSFCYVAFVLG